MNEWDASRGGNQGNKYPTAWDQEIMKSDHQKINLKKSSIQQEEKKNVAGVKAKERRLPAFP